jgi:hypothetical protein
VSFPLGWEERKTMKDLTFSGALEAFVLKQGVDRIPVAELCRRAGTGQLKAAA